MDYAVWLRQAADGSWTAWAEGMPGCAVRGASRESVLVEMRKAINLYVQGLLEEAIDQPPEADEGELVTVTV